MSIGCFLQPLSEQPAPVPSDVDDIDNIPLEEVEKAAILRMLESVDGNKSEAARRLNITRKTLLNKLNKYGYS